MSKQEWKKTKTIYWSDEYNDDFNELDGVEKRPPLKDNYQFVVKNPVRRLLDNGLYYLIAKPILGFFCYFHGIRYKNKKNLRALKHQGAFIYSNHVSASDAFKFQAQIIKFKKVNIVGYSDATQIPVAKYLVKSLGYLPVPTNPRDLLRFSEACEYIVKKKRQYVLIYPEAHIWPYYTRIRHFKYGSFRYPANCNAPVVPAVTVWKKRTGRKKPRQIVIFGTPIFPQEGKTKIENRDYLAEECYKQMVQISQQYNQKEYIKYIYTNKEEKKDAEE